MTTGRALTYVVVDTSVLSYFTAQSKDGKRYRELLGERVILFLLCRNGTGGQELGGATESTA